MFKGYNTDSRSINIGVDLTILNKILNHLNSSDVLVFEHKNDSLDISFINKKYKKFYSIKLLDLDYDELAIHQIDNCSTLELDSKYFNEIMNHFNDVGSTITINIDNNEPTPIKFTSNGDMTSLVMVLEEESLKATNMQYINLEFNMTNLQTFSKGYNLNKNMTLQLNNDCPVKLTYKIFDTGYIDYYIAPKIIDD